MVFARSMTLRGRPARRATCSAGNYAPDENDFVVPFLDRDGDVAESRQMFFELRQFLVVRREKGARASVGGAVEVLDDGPGDREPIVGRRAATNFV